MPGYEWKPISRGDEIPHGAILGGRTKTDGEVFVGRNAGQEAGKLNLDSGRMYNIWCHDGNDSKEGDILIVHDGHPIQWVHVNHGDALPADAVVAGERSGDGGKVFPCRKTDGGAIGKLNLKDGKVNNLWFHGDWFGKKEGEILVVGPKGAGAEWAAQYKKASGGEARGIGAWIKDHKGGIAIAGGVIAAGAAAAGIAGAAGAFDGHGHGGGSGGDAPAPAPAPAPSPPDAGGYSPAPAPAPHHPHHQPHHRPAHDPAKYDEEAMCDGIRAAERVQWLENERGMSHADAVKTVMTEFPGEFWWKPQADCDGSTAEARATWLMENRGMSKHDARVQVKSEFPRVFGGGHGGHAKNGKFPHTLTVVQTPDGAKLKFSVSPRNHDGTDLVAVHYTINDGQSMNFDINHPLPGTHTYEHVTPPGGGYPHCPSGARVKYWLAARVNGLIQEEPEHACGTGDRLEWTAP